MMNLRYLRFSEHGLSVPTTQLLLRGLVLAGGLTALLGTRLAGDAAPLYVELPLVGLLLLCVAKPDSHAGLLLVILLAINWNVHVPESSAWILCPAISFAVIHVCLAASTTSPFLSNWSDRVRRRWLSRALVLAASSVVAWLITIGFDRLTPAISAWIGATALLAIGGAAVWINPLRDH